MWSESVCRYIRMKESPLYGTEETPWEWSKYAKTLAEEYGLDYRTPIFAIHKEGHYGGIVGRSFSNLREYHRRVLEAKERRADFIKIMTTGLLDLKIMERSQGQPLDKNEVKEMVHIAHEEGFAVMSHYEWELWRFGGCGRLEWTVWNTETIWDEETISMLSPEPYSMGSHPCNCEKPCRKRKIRGCGCFLL